MSGLSPLPAQERQLDFGANRSVSDPLRHQPQFMLRQQSSFRPYQRAFLRRMILAH